MAADASTTAAAAVAPREFELPEVTFPPHLILSQAVVMASAAMEAYLEPTTGQQFRNLGGNGTTVQYLDDAFVKAALGALLQVTVKNAKGFSDVDRFTKPDLFVEVSVGGSYGKTTQKDGKENPDFNETLLLWPRQPDGGVVAQGPPVLTVRVFDDDVVGHDAVGVGTLTLQDGWETAPPADTQVDILSGEQVRGTVTLALEASMITKEEHQGDGADAAEMISNPQLAMPEGASGGLISNVAAATLLAPSMAVLAAPPESAVGTDPAAHALPAAVSDNDSAATATMEAAEEPSAAAPAAAVVEVTEADAAAAEANAAGGDPKAMMELATIKVKQAWAKLSMVFPNALLLHPVAYFSSKGGTQAWIHRNTRLKQVVISFRGTEQNLRDWVTDLRLALNSVTQDDATGALRTVGTSEQRDSGWRSWLGPISPLTRPSIHKGFYTAYRSVQPQIRDVLALITGGDSAWTVTATGHSLGGALAVLCAYDLAIARDTPYEVSCFTYGCPRVGNDRFAARFKEQVPKTFRVYNRLDLVPQVPWFLGYTHPPSEVRLDADSRLYLPQDNKVSVFGDGLVTEQIQEKLRSEQGAVAGATTWFRNRAGLVGSIFSRQGVASHATTEYVENLAGVMLAASSEQRYEVVDAVQAMRDALVALRKATEAAQAAS